jgi:hypothetical protein
MVGRLREETIMLRWMVCGAMAGAATMLLGCGYTDFEMAAKQRQIDALSSQLNALRAGASAACTDGKRPPRLASSPALSSR